jgi:hypothetical protein
MTVAVVTGALAIVMTLAEQRAALERFKGSESELYAKVRTAIYAEYRKSYGRYKQAWSLGAGMSAAARQTSTPCFRRS